MHTLQNLFVKIKKGLKKNESIDLPKWINERKQEKTRRVKDRLQHDLQVIADRKKYKENLEDFPEGTFQRLKQDYIWEEVLGYLRDPSDMTSASFACLTFSEILEERRTLILLPETLSVLHRENGTHGETCLLNTKDLFQLRGTSKSWKTKAESELFKTDLLGELWFDQNERAWKLEVDVGIFLDRKTVEDFLTVLSKEPGEESPIVRKLGVSLSDVSPGQEMTIFLDKIDEFLKIHGNSVWRLVYDGIFEIDDYLHLRNMLHRMPNLKALTCAWVGKPAVRCSPEELTFFESILTDKPFPMLDSLKYLQLVRVMNEPWVGHVLRRCSNLKYVSCINGNIPAENLTSMLENIPLERLAVSDETIILSPNPSVWHLKVLEIRHNCGPIKRSVLWTALDRLQATLEALRIDPIIRKDGSRFPLRLPRLKFLELSVICRRSIGFDDLLPLQSLETLIVRRLEKEKSSRNANSLIKIFGVHEMEKSNIWECIPNLTKLQFTFQKVGYRRNGSTFSKVKIGQNIDWPEHLETRRLLINLDIMEFLR